MQEVPTQRPNALKLIAIKPRGVSPDRTTKKPFAFKD